MNPLQALALVTQIVEQSRLTANEHRQLEKALTVLRNVVSPPPEKEPKVDA